MHRRSTSDLSQRIGFPISRGELDQVVAESDKKRFSFDESRTKIRANQGHSTEVDLQLKEVEPPEQLFRGTVERFLDSILAEGLKKMPRVEGLVLDLYYRQGQNIREIAPILDLHITRISQIKAQAVLRLRNYIERRWPTPRGVY